MKLRKIISILTEPNNLGGKFFYIDDPWGILKKYMKEYKNQKHSNNDKLDVFLVKNNDEI